jgi:phage gp29-like protein
MSQSVALAQADGPDEIDRLVDAAADEWEPNVDPLIQPVLELAQRSGSFKEFKAALKETLAQSDVSEFTRRLATATFKARGLGDGTDEV